MAIIEFRFIPSKDLSMLFITAISIFNYVDQLYSYDLTATGIKRLLATLSKLIFGIIYFILIVRDGDYKKISKIAQFKQFNCMQLLLLLLPGFLCALVYIIDYIIQVMSVNLITSVLDNNLGTFVQIITLFLVTHVGNNYYLKKGTYIHHRVGIIIITIGTVIFHVLKFFMFSPDGFASYANVTINTFILLGSIVIMSISQSGYVLAQSYLIHSCAYNPLVVIFITGVGFLIFYFPVMILLNGDRNKWFFLMDVDYPKMLFEFFVLCLYDYTYIKILKDLSMMHIVFNFIFIIALAYFPNPFIYEIFWFFAMIVVTMGFLLYIESMIVNACKLNYYVEEIIKKRGEDEFNGEVGESTIKKQLFKQDADNDDNNNE